MQRETNAGTNNYFEWQMRGIKKQSVACNLFSRKSHVVSHDNVLREIYSSRLKLSLLTFDVIFYMSFVREITFRMYMILLRSYFSYFVRTFDVCETNVKHYLLDANLFM